MTVSDQVAGGNNANTLHYITNTDKLNQGEMVLVDAGGELHGEPAHATSYVPELLLFSLALLYCCILSLL